ncbi:MAG TPA: 30S ribosomal protein S8 [Candidatus Limnocylindria bacterium]|nr:30S ribosomal protein S8 [Candidatus Limnocylindria bacterium]
MSTTSTDPIADMLSRIRNAIAVNKYEVSLPHSSVKESVAKLLKDNRYIDGVAVEKAEVGKTLKLTISQPQTNSRITEIKRMSTPGRRYYSSADDIPTVKRGRGIVIVSTSKGLMTGDQAKKQHIGGELICKVY